MRTQWFEKNVDLNLLSLQIQRFFKERRFDVGVSESDGETIVFALFTDNNKLKVFVRITGDPKNFTVGFEGEADRSRFVKMISPFLVMMGMGFFVRQKLKLLNFYDKLEKEFWFFMEKTVSDLVDSSSS